jgi:hypothetical protein
MILLWHVAAWPIITERPDGSVHKEQRCIRCCEVIVSNERAVACAWPGDTVNAGIRGAVACTPHDPHLVDDLKDEIRKALSFDQSEAEAML